MTSKRRIGSATSETRSQILDAVERLLVEDGYGAVTSRRVADRVGVNPGLVHYYFPTVDDLFVAAFRRGAEKNIERMAEALGSPQPLLGLWRLSSDAGGVSLMGEMLAAANHRKALRDELAGLAQRARRMQLEALEELLPRYGIDEEQFPASLVAAVIQGVALLVGREAALGLRTEHEAAGQAMERLIRRMEDGMELN